MKYLIIAAVLFLTVAVYQGAGQDGDTCATFNETATCCNETLACAWCNETGTCIGADAVPDNCTDICVSITTSEPPSTAPPTMQPVVDACNAFNSSDCCDQVDQGCGLCNDSSTGDVCQNVTETGCTGTDQCAVIHSSTMMPIETTPVSNASTMVPVETTAEDITTPEVTTGGPTSTASPSPCPPSGQHFDAASFIGGIILCASLVAITFFGCKIYKGRTEQKYQQF